MSRTSPAPRSFVMHIDGNMLSSAARLVDAAEPWAPQEAGTGAEGQVPAEPTEAGISAQDDPHAAAFDAWRDWAAQLAAGMDILREENRVLKSENRTLSIRLTAVEAGPEGIPALRRQLQELRDEMQQQRAAHTTPTACGHGEQLAAMQQQVAGLQQAVADHSTAVRSWASIAAGAPHAANPAAAPCSPASAPCTQAPVPCTVKFRLVQTQAVSGLLPTTAAAAGEVAMQVLQEIVGGPMPVQAACVLQARSPAPAAIMIDVAVPDAHVLRARLWDRLGQEQQRRCGWRVSVYLPQEEFTCKQSLWAQFGARLTAAVQAGKRLVYSQRHRAVRVEGETDVMRLSAAAAA